MEMVFSTLIKEDKMSITTWFHKKRCNNIKKHVDKELLKIMQNDNGQVTMEYLPDYFEVKFLPSEATKDCDRILLVWKKFKEPDDINLNKYFPADLIIDYEYFNYSNKYIIKNLARQAQLNFAKLEKIRNELSQFPYLANYKLALEQIDNKHEYKTKVNLIPYNFAKYFNDVKKYHTNISDEILNEYKEYCLEMFAPCRELDADNPIVLISTFKTWYDIIFIPRITLEARNNECKETLDEIKKAKAKLASFAI